MDNTTDGAQWAAGHRGHNNLTIKGNGDTIARSTASGTPAFRLFDVAAGASLTLTNLTLAKGCLVGGPAGCLGGGIYTSGSLTLTMTCPPIPSAAARRSVFSCVLFPGRPRLRRRAVRGGRHGHTDQRDPVLQFCSGRRGGLITGGPRQSPRGRAVRGGRYGHTEQR